jgi:hypothetical protein
MAERRKLRRTPGRLVKLAGGTLAIDTLPSGVTTNPSRLTVSGIITAQTPDRENDVVLTAGIDLSDHANYPLVLLEHGLMGYTLPIAKAEDPQTGYAVRRFDDRLEATSYFTTKTAMSEQVFALYDDKIMRAFSISFIPTSLKKLPPNPENPLTRPGFLVEACKLTEYSCCSLGCNADALTVAYEKNLLAGHRIDPFLRKSLSPFVLTRKRLVNGATLNHESKTMPDDLTTDTATDPITDIPAADEVAAQDDDRLPGARFLDCYFQILLQARECLEGGLTSQEHPPVKELTLREIDDVQDKLQAIADLYAQEYPDLDPLSVPPPLETETGSDKETKSDSDSDEGEPGEKNKRFKATKTKGFSKSATACIKSAAEMMHEAADMETLPKGYRKGMHATADELSGLVKDAGDPADDETVPKGDYEKLLKHFQTLEANHKNLVARVQRAIKR